VYTFTERMHLNSCLEYRSGMVPATGIQTWVGISLYLQIRV